jgi:predicted transposase YbfD/YdcC
MQEKENMFLTLSGHLSSVADPRIFHKITYRLDEILFLAVSAVVSDCTDWQDIVDFGHDKLEWLQKYFPYNQGIPSHDTMNRVFSLIDKGAFESMFRQWASQHFTPSAGLLISFDGKSLRRSATKLEQQMPRAEGGKGAEHLLGAWCNEQSVCFDVRAVGEKENEIVAIKSMLEYLEIEGCVIRADAIACQKDIAEKIIQGRADYVFGLKLNQKNLFEAVETLFSEDVPAMDKYDTKDEAGHGRVERRVCRAAGIELLADKTLAERWPGLRSIIELERERVIIATGVCSSEKRYYISSLAPSAENNAKYVREHWGIENRLHYILDVYFGEDASRKRSGNAAANFGTLLRMALNLVYAAKGKDSVKRTLKKASRTDKFRETILGLS